MTNRIEEFEIHQLITVAKQIIQIERHELGIQTRFRIGQLEKRVGPIEDQCRQVLQCLLSATWELDNPQPDSEEFTKSVIDESRDRLGKLLKAIGAVPEVDEMADTERSPQILHENDEA